MGTGIHGGFIKLNPDNSTTPVKTSWGMDRNYTLFAILAGVRNGRGFAGVYRHEPVTPIAEDRGIPDFVNSDEEGQSTQFYNPWFNLAYADPDEQEFGTWLGDHSFTYMTVQEILDWAGWDEHLQSGGVVTREEYENTIAQGKDPEYWSGDVSGTQVVKISQHDYEKMKKENCPTDKVTHIITCWKNQQTLRGDFDWFLEEIKRIADEHGPDTYLVIGFDC